MEYFANYPNSRPQQLHERFSFYKAEVYKNKNIRKNKQLAAGPVVSESY